MYIYIYIYIYINFIVDNFLSMPPALNVPRFRHGFLIFLLLNMPEF